MDIRLRLNEIASKRFEGILNEFLNKESGICESCGCVVSEEPYDICKGCEEVLQ